MRGIVDGTRRVLRMTGGDAAAVLQGVVTNDVGGIGRGEAVYAALLTPQGKYLVDFFLVAERGGAAAGAILIDVAAARADDLARRLSMYCLRRDARVEGEAGLSVVLLWGEGAPGGLAVPDPRDPSLGWRLYVDDPAAGLAGVEAGDLADWHARRIAAGVPETGVELVPEETYILEAGFERLRGVDFRKGCYVGQEVTARMKHRAELRRRLLRVRVEGAAPAPGTAVETAEGKPAGTLFSVAGGIGLAELRLDRIAPGLAAGAARITVAEG